MIPPPGETPRRTGEAVGGFVGGTAELVDEEELAGEVVVVLTEEAVVGDTVVEDGLLDDPVDDAVDEPVAKVADPSVVVVWLVGSAGEVFGGTEVGSD